MAQLAETCRGEASEQAELIDVTRNWRHPPSFYCPISQHIMHDPVVLEDGHTYERQQIQRWLDHHDTSPVSGLKLGRKDMFPNHALRNAIEEYFQEVQDANRRAVWRTRHEAQLQTLESDAPFLRTIDALMQCSLLMNADFSTDQVLRQIMDEARALVGAEVASVFLVDERRKELYSVVSSNGCEVRIPLSAGIAGHVATSGESVIVHDTYSDKRFTRRVDVQTGFKTCDMMCVPLQGRKGEIFGVVQLINKLNTSHKAESQEEHCSAVQLFTEEDLQFLKVFASQASMAVISSGFTIPGRRDTDLKASCRTIFEGDEACETDQELDVCRQDSLCSMESSCSMSSSKTVPKARKSGRARQRAAKYWNKIRQRTPSPHSRAVDQVLGRAGSW